MIWKGHPRSLISQLRGFVRKTEYIARGVVLAIGSSPLTAVILDRDYRSEEERSRIQGDLAKKFDLVHVFERKELENYALVPAAIHRAVAYRLSRRKATNFSENDVLRLLRRSTSTFRGKVRSRLVAARTKELRRGSKDESTITEETLDFFDRVWRELDSRLLIVPGKDVLSRLNAILQEEYSVSVSLFSIIDAMDADDVTTEIADLLRSLDRFSRRKPM